MDSGVVDSIVEEVEDSVVSTKMIVSLDKKEKKERKGHIEKTMEERKGHIGKTMQERKGHIGKTMEEREDITGVEEAIKMKHSLGIIRETQMMILKSCERSTITTIIEQEGATKTRMEIIGVA